MQKKVGAFLARYFAWFFLTICSFQTLADDVIRVGGYEMTATGSEAGSEAAVFVAGLTLPDDPLLEWYYVFDGDANAADLSVSFNGRSIPILSPDTFEVNTLDFIMLDIDSVRGQFGEITFTLTSTGGGVVKLLLVTRAGSSKGVKTLIPAMLNVSH